MREKIMEFREKTKKGKKKLWDKIREEVDRIADRNGRPIDEGIKESIAVFRIFGFKTSASCWGHLNRGVKAPWIDFGEEPPKELINMVKGRVNLASIHVIPEVKEFRRKNLKEQNQMFELLDEFYTGRQMPFDVRLVLLPQGIYGNTRLINAGVSLQNIRSKQKQKEKLDQYRQEMAAFAAFLKEKYFSA